MDSLDVNLNLSEMIAPVIKWLRELGFAFSGPAATWTVGQLGLIAFAWLVAVTLNKKSTAAGEALRGATSGSPALGKLLQIVIPRVRWFIFAGMLWASVAIMRAITWPSRSHLVLAVASLATAWLLIVIVTRLIRHKTIANLVATAAWSVAALNIVGLLPQAITLLDSIAFNFGDFRLSLLVVIKAVVMISVALWLAVTLGQFADARIRAIEDLTPSLRVLVGKLAKALLIILAIVWGLNVVGIDLTAFAVFSGAIGLGLGFGLQKVVSNLISGFILLADKSIKPGDVISVDDTYGRINQLAARYVSVVARDGREYLIPNEDLITNKVINWSFTSELVRLDVHFGVSYQADPHEVRRIARETAAPQDRVVSSPAPVCHISGFGDSSVDYILRFWIADPHAGTLNVRGNVYLALWDAFKEAGIEIPYPHRHLMVSSPLPVEIRDGQEPARA